MCRNIMTAISSNAVYCSIRLSLLTSDTKHSHRLPIDDKRYNNLLHYFKAGSFGESP